MLIWILKLATNILQFDSDLISVENGDLILEWFQQWDHRS